jgi:hypothetical protein
MDELILRRLVLAKTFLLSAKTSLNRHYDENSLALAAVQLHDAVDNLLGAVATHRGLHLKDNSYLNQTYDEVVNSGLALTHRTQIKTLNTYRNNIKHQGIVPNSKDLIALLPTIDDFCEKTCNAVFSVKLSSISRVDLIDDAKAKQELARIQRLIEANNYKQVMIDLATLLFTEFTEKHLAVWRLSSITDAVIKRHTRYDTTFPNGVANDLHINLMEVGISPSSYHAFSGLTPEVGRDIQTKELAYRADGHTWYEDNWTEENSLFCFNFVIDALTSQQRSYSGYKTYYRNRKHKVRFIRDSFTPKYAKHDFKEHVAGEEMDCILIDYADNQFQPCRFSENGLTQALLIEESGIILLKVNDIEVISETFSTLDD